MSIQIECVTQENAEDLQCLIEDMRLPKDAHYVERCLKKERITLLASVSGQRAGYCFLNFKPAYALFVHNNIPEMQDLNTHPDFRQQGVATALIQKCEELAQERGAQELGLGVGLYAGYGNAQRLYVKMGFIPDGQGVMYDAKPITPCDIRPIDDDLCLMMVKVLS